MNAVAQPHDIPSSHELLQSLREFVEHEAALLDDDRFEEWEALFAEDGVYWAPAQHDQQSPITHVSLFFDDRDTIRTRVARLRHPQIHCQEPPSRCVRVLSGVRLDSQAIAGGAAEYRLDSRFLMLEDRTGQPQRVYGGRYLHHLRRGTGGSLQIVEKKVVLTNCDQSFPVLTQPF